MCSSQAPACWGWGRGCRQKPSPPSGDLWPLPSAMPPPCHHQCSLKRGERTEDRGEMVSYIDLWVWEEMVTYFILCICVSSGRLTAAVYHRRAGWQGDLLELWGNYGNRRLVYPWLCQVENKELTWLNSAVHQLFVTEAESTSQWLPLKTSQLQLHVGGRQPHLPVIRSEFV